MLKLYNVHVKLVFYLAILLLYFTISGSTAAASVINFYLVFIGVQVLL